MSRTSLARLAARGLLLLVTIAGMTMTAVPVEGRGRPVGAHSFPGTLNLPDGVLSVALAGDLVYVVSSHAGGWISTNRLSIYDLSSQAPQVTMGSVYLGYGGGRDDMLAADGDFVYLITWTFVVVDVSDSAAPRVVETLAWPEWPTCVAAAGGYAYLGDSTGLHVIDVADPASPSPLGSVALSSTAVTMALRGPDVFVGTLDARVAVVDVSDPRNPVVVAILALPDAPYDVEVNGARAYVADGEAGLQVLDVSRPAAPRITGDVGTPGDARRVAVSGARAYVVDSHPGIFGEAFVTDLQVIDVSNPFHPLIVNSIAGVDRAEDAANCWDTSEDRGIVAGNGRVVVVGSILHQWLGDCVGGPFGCDEVTGYLKVAPRAAFEPPYPGADASAVAAPAAASMVTTYDISAPTTTVLRGNDPNPFNPKTTIRYDLPQAARVRLGVYDLAGRLMRTLVDGDETAAGRRQAVWDGRDNSGRPVAAGAYICRLEAGGYRGTIRMTLVK